MKQQPRVYVVMGVSGSGKSLIGERLAGALDVPFVEGDDYHPPENVKRMSLGVPLSDGDRLPWLRSLAQRIRDATEAGTGLVLACSALKRSYRDLLRKESGTPDLQLIYLKGPQALVAQRVAGRRGHFMPAALLDSQFAALEEPASDEPAWVCDIRESPEQIVAALLARASA